MNSSEIKKILISSLDKDSNMGTLSGELQDAGVSYDFTPGFNRKVLDKIFSSETLVVSREVEFSRYLNLAFSRIALTGVAAIILLLISLFLMEGSLSLNSILGLNDTQGESIVCLLTGN
jgi:hypothetical protein